MSHFYRAKLNQKTTEYFEELQNRNKTIPEAHAQAIALRMKFFEKYILDRVNSVSPYNCKEPSSLQDRNGERLDLRRKERVLL